MALVVDLEAERNRRLKPARYVTCDAVDGRVVVRAGDLELVSLDPAAADTWADGIKHLASVARAQRAEQG
jgi:hypothetical protein